MHEKATAPAKTSETKPRPADFFSAMQEEMARLFDERWPAGAWSRLMTRLPAAGGEWAPKADIFERNGDIVIKAELPGVAKEDVDVSVEQDSLVIKGERKAEKEVKEESYYRMERSFGSFYRRLPIPEGVSADQISATYADGVLEVRIPKPAAEKSRPTKVNIS